ncbi:MAG: MATE family efflux transporter [Oscillospiraceae bacterium]|jgi:putative MATE family efflux protein
MLRRLISCSRMVPQDLVCGALPSSREGYRTVIQIAWPCIIETLLVCGITFVDMIMVSVVGSAAIAAVGITTQPKFILLATIMSLNIGVTAVVSRRFGQKDQAGANRCLKQCLVICCTLSLLLSGLGYFFAEPFLAFAGAEPSYLQAAADYFRVIMVGQFFYGLALTINAAQRGCGNTRISMTTNIAANIVNLTLNYFLIYGIGPFPRLEVLGSGIATAMGQLAAFLLALFSLLRKNGYLKLSFPVLWKPDKSTLSGVFRIGTSALAEQLFVRIGFLFYAKIVAGLGSTAFATHQICLNISNISFSLGDGFAMAAAALVGQCLGSRRPDLSKLYGSICQRLAFLCSTVLAAVFFFGRYGLIRLFSREPAILASGAAIMIVLTCVTHIQTSQVIFSGCLRGAGDAKYTALTSLFSIALFRPTMTWLLCYPAGFGVLGAWLAFFLDQTIRIVFYGLRFQSGKWMEISL